MRALVRSLFGRGSGRRRRTQDSARPAGRSEKVFARSRSEESYREPPLVVMPRSFWSTAVAYPGGGGQPIAIGSHPTASPQQALRWLEMRLGQLLEQLAPAECGPGRAWLRDERAKESALSGLCLGNGYTVTVRDDEGVLYVFSALPGAGAEPVVPVPG